MYESVRTYGADMLQIRVGRQGGFEKRNSMMQEGNRA